ncbi:MAG: SusC/RagA family TonB-linked outer membrane protein [Hydrotalea flava]|nr:SusC/RagA family TonB-linked outer membrane protein [Hydrotalea flava]NIM38428.1 SusC/RagA family TonB-linked outer membrane protein [Hydrotalea flava]NIN03598.1 SusC/RagA family TonB-linked outer membrane protein [Hydrotalea flava]NIN15285.1 SusC/RagA family TonB-linked outer membrane protein [Hydrotalea flava]NIO94354.1 SusC/RagA family TonB-linked outer membrane protein [Hydrotalea flava]
MLYLFLALFSTAAFAQTKVITGKVTDSKDGSPVAGATVVVKGTQYGTQTGPDGTFKLNAPADSKKLVISSLNFNTQEIAITGGTINVSLTPSADQLGDVVVIGYGTARKNDLTGALSSVKAKDFNQGIISSPDQLLQNKVAGLQIVSNGGQPGTATTVKLRGNSSLIAGQQPLYVIDGVPLDGRTARPSVTLGAGGFGTTPDDNPLLFINMNDIAQVDVLKDASATAIYGSRGANGVIVITTKKATAGPLKVDAGVSYGVNAGYMKKYDVLNAAQFRQALTKYKQPSSLDGGATVDPFKAIEQNTIAQNYNVAFSGGNENGRFRASFLASSQPGIIKNTDLSKYIASFGGEYKMLDKRLTIGFNMIAGHVTYQLPNVSNTAGSQGNLISSALSWNPTLPFNNSNGTFNYPTNGSGNPMSLLAAYSDVSNLNTFLGNISASYKLVKNLSYKFLYAVNHATGSRLTNIDGYVQGYSGLSGLGFGAISGAVLTSQTFTHTLNYDANITKKLKINAVGGYEYWTSDYSNQSFSATGFNTNLDQTKLVNIPYTSILQNGNTQNPPSIYVDPTTSLQSYFARASLNYDEKYFLTATMRADGSNKFGANNKYGYFPSVGARWVLSNEKFLQNSKLFSNLALRASWGITGSQEFPASASQESFGVNSYNNIGQSNVFNPNLKWQQTSQTDFGLDFGLFNGRIFGSFDYYNKNTTNILFQSNAIQPAPAATYWINLPGHIMNKGFEFSLGAVVVDHKDFGWNVNFNMAYNKNKLTDFFAPGTTTPLQILTGQITGQGVSGTLAQIMTNNQPIDAFYLKPFGGFDANGNQIIGANPVIAGDPNPTTVYGVGTDIRYKKFTLTINGGGQGGYLIYSNTATNITNLAGIVAGRNIDKAAYNSAEGVTSAVGASTRFLQSGNFFKLRNATINYQVGNVGKYIKNLSAFVSGNNLFVITKFTGFDPEVNTDHSNAGYPSLSIEYLPYPTQRTVSFGVNFSL